MANDFFKDILADHEIELVETDIPAPTVLPEKEYKPEPRIQTPHKENSDPATFKVGTWEWQPGSWIRLALPHPRWPEPSAIATDEVARVYDAECALRLEAEIVLRQYLWYVKFDVLHPGFHSEPSHQLAGERIAWLKGVWNSRSIRCPEPNEFVAMAIEPEPRTPKG
jgi:hypothetical protein